MLPPVSVLSVRPELDQRGLSDTGWYCQLVGATGQTEGEFRCGVLAGRSTVTGGVRLATASLVLNLGLERTQQHSSMQDLSTAAALFAHLGARPQLTPPVSHLTVPVLDSLQLYARAQAQQLAFAAARERNTSHNAIARIAEQLALYHDAALLHATQAASQTPSFRFPSRYVNSVRLCAHHYHAVAQYRKSIHDLASNRYGHELARLQVAIQHCTTALDSDQTGVEKQIVQQLKALKKLLLDNQTRATRDNDLIYLETPPLESALPPILPVSLVTPTLPPQIKDPFAYLHEGDGGFGLPWFRESVPLVVKEAERLYEDRREQFCEGKIRALAREADEQANETLHSLNLPGSLQALLQPSGLPPSLLAKRDELRRLGGTTLLKGMMADVRKLATTNRRVLDDTSSILAKEPNSVDDHFRARVDGFAGTLEHARVSDGVVRSKFGEWEMRMCLLEGDVSTLKAAVSSLANPDSRSVSQPSSQALPLQSLRAHLDVLSSLQSARQALLDNLERQIKLDDSLPSLRAEHDRLVSVLRAKGSESEIRLDAFEVCFEIGLSKFERFRIGIKESQARQQDVLDLIRSSNASFLAARKSDPALKSRQAALQELDQTYHKFVEIQRNLVEGLKFYNDFSKILVGLLNEVKSVFNARSIEGQRMRLETTTLEARTPRISRDGGAYDPAKHGPIRFDE